MLIKVIDMVGWVTDEQIELVRAAARYPDEDAYTIDQWFARITYPADRLYFIASRYFPYYADPIQALVRLAFAPAERAIMATGPHSPAIIASLEAVRQWWRRPCHVLGVQIDRAALAAAAGEDPRTRRPPLSEMEFQASAAAHAMVRVAELMYALGAYPFERPEMAMTAIGHLQQARELALLALNSEAEYVAQEADMQKEVERMSLS